MSKAKIKSVTTKIATVAAVCTAVVGVTSLITDAQPLEPGTRISVDATNGNAECIGTFESCNTDPRVVAEKEILDERVQNDEATPLGNGPWLFFVTNDEGLGLKIRSGGTIEDHTLANAESLAPVWVRCQMDTGFDPEGAGNSTWFAVAWSEGPQGTQSESSSDGTAWAYSAYLTASGTNGQVPTCDQNGSTDP